LQKRGYRVRGTETDPVAAALATKRTGAIVYPAPLPPTNAGHFDFVSLLHVLEHVPDPRQTLNAVRESLKPGGKLLLVLPNADSLEAAWFGASWYHLDLPRHLWGFTPRSLVRLVETCGFAVQNISYTPFLFAPQSLLRSAKTANGVIPGHPVLRAESGESTWQTRVFTGLLAASDKLGKTFPGEIMELMGTRADD
ncbi:MAG: class I SAM-dependent methyltransferase, partial [Armatimonadetes bacterium]|nr:class I SAM-dependent methyltransferase [Armatimonadota bacterium]